MKFLPIVLLATSFSAFSAEVVSAKLDATKQNILVDINYGGGCKKHNFSLRLGDCLESMPVQCGAQLIHEIEGGFDMCEAYIQTTVVFNLAKYGLKDQYYKGARITINGDMDYRTGKPSRADVRLP